MPTKRDSRISSPHDGPRALYNPDRPDHTEKVTARYLGSKLRVVRQILDIIGGPTGPGTFVDAFAGTGAVAREAALRGWPVWVNDHLFSSSVLAYGNVMPKQSAEFATLGGYKAAVKQLNEANPLEGFIWREYSPASAAHIGFERRYFTEKNAAKIDGVRAQISVLEQQGAIGADEKNLLLADLLVAASRVANTAGTYGCFLKKWQAAADSPLRLRARALLQNSTHARRTSIDVNSLEISGQDTAYFDPPYTKRQYAAYYHVLETIAQGDEPVVTGVCGIRPWRDRASDFCYKTRALGAIEKTLTATRANAAYLSYSSEGFIDLQAITDRLSTHGKVTVYDLGVISRYTPNDTARHNNSFVTEYVLKFESNVK